KTQNSKLSRLWGAASPFAAATLVVFALLGLALLTNKTPPPKEPDNTAQVFPPVPTYAAAPIASSTLAVEGTGGGTDLGGVPGPESTSKPVSALFSPTSVGTTMLPTVGIRQSKILELSQPTPIFEGDPTAASSVSDWHEVRDPAYGYSV